MNRQRQLQQGRKARRAHLGAGGRHRRTFEPVAKVLGREARRSGGYADR